MSEMWAIMGAIYEYGALVGRVFKDDVESLNQLLLAELGEEQKTVAFLKQKAGGRLRRYQKIFKADPDSLCSLVVRTEYPVASLPLQENYSSTNALKLVNERLVRAAQQEVDLRTACEATDLAETEGIGFGLSYPELTWELVSRLHNPVGEDIEDWARFASLGGGQLVLHMTTGGGKEAAISLRFKTASDKANDGIYDHALRIKEDLWSKERKALMALGTPEIEAEVSAFKVAGEAYPWRCDELPEAMATDSPEEVEVTVVNLVREYVERLRPELASVLQRLDERGNTPDSIGSTG